MNQELQPASEQPESENGEPTPKQTVGWRRFAVIAAIVVVLAIILAACAVVLTPEAPAGDEATTSEAAQAEAASEEATAAPAEEAAGETDGAEADSGEASGLVLSGDEESYNGIPVGFTEEGFPYRGSLDAPITMYEYSDYQCPFCSRYFIQTEPAINEQYVRDGTLRVVFRDFPLEQLHPNAPGAHAASLCVAEQGAALYWEMHAELFRTQAEWSNDPQALDFYAQLAEEVGADMDQYNACMESGMADAMIAASLEEARTLGFSGTPSFRMVMEESGDAYTLVGAQPYEQFAAYLDAMAAGEAPVDAAAQGDEGDGEIPFWATTEGLAPDPDKPGQTMAGDHYRGNPDASVVVVEFSDYQCPYCRRHVEDTQPVLDEQFVDTDQVMWVFKHFPLQIHPQAPMAGAASECAADQGKFWEMHDLLFAETQAWSVSDPTEALTTLAGDLELDVDAFAACLADEASLQLVNADMADGQPFVRGTPTFIVLYNGQGSIIPGALPAESFSETLQQVIDEAGG